MAVVTSYLKTYFLVCVILVASITAAVDAAASHHLRQRRKAEVDDHVYCRLGRVDVEWPEEVEPVVENENEHKPGFICWTDDDVVLDIRVSLPVQAKELDLVDGHYVLITKVVTLVEDATLFLTPESEIVLYEPNANRRDLQQRQLAPKEGTSLVLVLRVTYRGTAPSLTSSQLAGRIFGLGSNAEANNLVSQTSACSFGKLTLVPGSGHSAINNGVVEINIATQVTGDNTARSLENLVQTAATSLLGSLSSYQHIMMIFPNHPEILSSGRTFLAYGYLGGSRTVFSDQWAGRLTAVLHEFGHNWNLNHSGKGTDTYGDMSGCK